jgi:hypothetical protein
VIGWREESKGEGEGASLLQPAERPSPPDAKQDVCQEYEEHLVLNCRSTEQTKKAAQAYGGSLSGYPENPATTNQMRWDEG